MKTVDGELLTGASDADDVSMGIKEAIEGKFEHLGAGLATCGIPVAQMVDAAGFAGALGHLGIQKSDAEHLFEQIAENGQASLEKAQSYMDGL